METRVLLLVAGVAAGLGGSTTWAVSSCDRTTHAIAPDGVECKREPPASALQAVATSASPDPVPGATAAAPTSARPDGSFLTAEFPTDVEHSKDVRETVVGDIEQSSATARVGDASLSITASVLPAFVIAVATDDMLYRKARNELLKTFSARSTSWGSCTHAGFACRKLLYAADDGREGMARLFLHDGVLVVINAIYDEDEATAQRFLAAVH